MVNASSRQRIPAARAGAGTYMTGAEGSALQPRCGFMRARGSSICAFVGVAPVRLCGFIYFDRTISAGQVPEAAQCDPGMVGHPANRRFTNWPGEYTAKVMELEAPTGRGGPTAPRFWPIGD